MFPLLPRYCPRPTTLASGTPRATAVAAGATVIVAPLAAMFDRDRVERAEEFVVGRPEGTYYHFGHGLHRCLGMHMARAALGALFTTLLEEVEIEPGRIVYDGPVVAKYEVTVRPRETDDANRSDDTGCDPSGRPRAA